MQPVTPKKSCLASSAASSPTCTSPNSTTATPPSPALYRGVHPTYSPPPKQKKRVRFADPISKYKSFHTTSYSKEVITEEETPKRGKKRKEIRENVCHTEERDYPPPIDDVADGEEDDCPCNCPSCPYYRQYYHTQMPEKVARHHQQQNPKQKPGHHRSKNVLTGEPRNPYKPSKVEMTMYFDLDDSSFVAHLQPQSTQPVMVKKRPLQPRSVNTHLNPQPSQKYAPPPRSPDFPDMNPYSKMQMPNKETCWSFDGSTDMSWPSYYPDPRFASSPQLRRKPAYTKLKTLPSATSFHDEYEDYDQVEAPGQQLSRQLQRVRPRKSSNSGSSFTGSSSGSILSAADLERKKWEEDLRREQLRRRERERRREKERRLERALEERALHGLGLSGHEYYDPKNVYASDRWDGGMI